MKMKKNKFLSISVVCLFALCAFSSLAHAGKGSSAGSGKNIYDVPTEADCRVCHDDPARFTYLVASNPDTHHALLTHNSEYTFCSSCHKTEWNNAVQAEVVKYPGNCLDCHDVKEVEGPPSSENVHHLVTSETFVFEDCDACH